MNKKVMALAVAGALSAPAAALAQVTISGGINLLYFSHDPDNKSSAQSTDVMQSSESELRFNGTDKIGGGNEVWFQCASSIDGVIQGNVGGIAGMCTRNSAIGFKGGWGNAYFGNWDTPLKLLQNRTRGWFSGTNALYGGGYTLLGSGASSGNANSPATGGGSTATSMYRRQANSVNYASPNWGGFSLAAAFSAANETATIPDSVSLNPRLYGLNAMFASGIFWVGAGFESHSDYNPGNVAAATYANGGTDTNITISAGVKLMGSLDIRGSYSESSYDVTSSTDLKAKGFALYADWNISGPHTIHAAYIMLDDISGSSTTGVGAYKSPMVGGVKRTDTGGQVMTVAYSYDLSKRTQLVASYNIMDNDTNANFNQGVTATTLGGKQQSLGFAVRYSF